MKRICLIGCGFLGGYLCRRLLGARPQEDPEFKLIVVDKLKKNAFAKSPITNPLKDNPNLEYRWNSAGDPWKLLDDFAQGIDAVIYTAAIADVPYAIKNPIDTLITNVINPATFMEFLKAINFGGRVIMMSSESSYGHQEVPKGVEWAGINEDTATIPKHTNIYGVSKFAQEGVAYVAGKTGLKVIVLRSGTMYGAGSRPAQAIPIFVGQALAGKAITLEGGSQTRDFNHVENVVDAILAVLDAPETDVVGQVFNIGSGTEMRFDDLAKSIKRVLKSQSNIEIKPWRPGEEGLRIKLDISKARKVLKYEPRVQLFPDGLADVAEYVAFYDLMWSKEEVARLRGLVGSDKDMMAQLMREQMAQEELVEEKQSLLIQEAIKSKAAQQQFPPKPKEEEPQAQEGLSQTEEKTQEFPPKPE